MIIDIICLFITYEIIEMIIDGNHSIFLSKSN